MSWLYAAGFCVWIAITAATRPVPGAGPQAVEPLRFSPADSVHAFYYLWYGDPNTDGRYRHWDHEILPHWDERQRGNFPTGKKFHPPDSVHSPYYPLLGPYSSQDPAVIRRHVGDLLDAGVGVIVVSWWGPVWRQGTTDTQGVSTDAVLGDVIRELEGQPLRDDGRAMKLAFHMEPYPGRTVDSVREDLRDLHKRFGGSPALLRVGPGQLPVYYLYDSYRIPASEWAELLTPSGNKTVRGTDVDGCFLGLVLNRQDTDTDILAGGFDGFYTYFASEAVSFASNPSHWPALATWASTARKLFVPSVGPGYDDRRIRPWNAAAFRDRQEGDRYQTLWSQAEGALPDAVSIVSFNEWGEGTQIEPAQPWKDPTTGEAFSDYGPGGPYLYLNITARASASFQGSLMARGRHNDVQQGGPAPLDGAEHGVEGGGSLLQQQQQKQQKQKQQQQQQQERPREQQQEQEEHSQGKEERKHHHPGSWLLRGRGLDAEAGEGAEEL